MNELSPVPEGPVRADGSLTPGRFRGALDEVRWGYPTGWIDGQVKRALGRKRWFQVVVLSRRRVIVCRILDQGLVGSGVIWVADPLTGRVELEHRLTGMPLANLAVGPVAGRGADAFVRLPNARVFLRRHATASAWTLEAQLPGHALSLSLDTRSAPTPLTTIDELRPGSATPSAARGLLVARHVGLEARGTIRFRSEVQGLEADAVAMLEYGNGFVTAPDAAPEEVLWSSALASPLDLDDEPGVASGEGALRPRRPWVVASDLGGGQAYDWFHGEPRFLGPADLTRGHEGEAWRIAGDGVALEFMPRVSLVEASAMPPALTRQGPLRAAAQAVAMRHALVVGFFSGQASGARFERALGVCDARAFGL